MKNKIKSVLFVVAVLVISINFISITDVQAQGDNKKVKDTTCKIKGTETIVGYSNDCVSGSGSCIDRTCGLPDNTITHQ